jgi:hypothetical protein
MKMWWVVVSVVNIDGDAVKFGNTWHSYNIADHTSTGERLRSRSRRKKTMVQIRGRPATWVDRFVRPAHWLRIKSDQINCEFDSVRIASEFVACI